MSTGLRICNRGVRVWSGRFQIFSENFRGDCENCILRNFSGCFFSRQDFFHQDCFKNLRKNLQKFNRISAWLPKLHPLCAEEQFEWFFWRKCNLTIFFEVWIKIFLNCVEKLWARSWNFLLWVQRYKFWSEKKLGFQHMFPDFLFKLIGHMLKLKFTCSKENFENVFSEKTLPVSELQNRSKNVADFCEKSHLGCQNCTARIGKFFWGVCVVWKKSFFTFELWVKSSRNFCSWYTSMLCCQNSSQRIQNYFFELFYGRISFSKIFSDFERNSFRPLRTL